MLTIMSIGSFPPNIKVVASFEVHSLNPLAICFGGYHMAVIESTSLLYQIGRTIALLIIFFYLLTKIDELLKTELLFMNVVAILRKTESSITT